jgi:hypothetical protein
MLSLSKWFYTDITNINYHETVEAKSNKMTNVQIDSGSQVY